MSDHAYQRRSALVVICHYSTVVTILGAWVIWQATLLREGPGYAAVGPRTFPLVVGSGVLLSGLALMWERLARPRHDPDPVLERGAESERADWRILLYVGVLLAGYILLYQPLGFVLATIFFLPACGRALGSQSVFRDVAIAVGLASITYLVFTRLLGLELPGGPIDEQLRGLANLGKPPVGAE